MMPVSTLTSSLKYVCGRRLGLFREIAEQFASEEFSDLAEGARQLAQEIDQGFGPSG